MKKKIILDFNKILKYFIIIQPILDVLTSISSEVFHLNLTIGIFVRTLFLLFVIYSTIFIYNKKKCVYIYVIFLIYFLVYIFGIFYYKNGSNVFAELQGLLRSFYFPLLLVSLYSIRDKIKIEIKDIIFAFFIYISLIVVPTILNLGFESYQITKKGTVGFFSSANEIGAILSIVLPFVFVFLNKSKKNITFLLIMILYIFVIVNIGTKTPILSLIVVLFFIIIWVTIKNILLKKYMNIIYILIINIVIVFITLVFLPKTAFYNNIKVHMEYLKINNISEAFSNFELMDHFVFSERLTFLDNRNQLYNNSSFYFKMFGMGYCTDGKENKMVEIDCFDIYYNHGIFGFGLFFSIYIYVILNVIKNNYNKLYNFNVYLKFVSILLSIILSIFGGHVIISPAVSFFVICILLCRTYEKKYMMFLCECKSN